MGGRGIARGLLDLCLRRLAFAAILLFPLVVLADTNRTIDDTKGDSVTGITPVYKPQSAWEDATCSGCFVKPNVQQAFDGTWTAATYSPDKTETSIEFSFKGTAIYVYFIIPQTIQYTDTTTDCNFALDGGSPEHFLHTPDPSSADILYNQLVFQRTGLSNDDHSLKIYTSGLDHNVFTNFDYAVYTVPDDPPLPAITTSANPGNGGPATTVATGGGGGGGGGNNGGGGASNGGGGNTNNAPAGTTTQPQGGNSGSPIVSPNSGPTTSSSFSSASPPPSSSSSPSSTSSGVLTSVVVVDGSSTTVLETTNFVGEGSAGPTSTTTDSPSGAGSTSSSSISSVAIAGIAVGSVAALVILIGILFCFRRRKHHQLSLAQHQQREMEQGGPTSVQPFAVHSTDSVSRPGSTLGNLVPPPIGAVSEKTRQGLARQQSELQEQMHQIQREIDVLNRSDGGVGGSGSSRDTSAGMSASSSAEVAALQERLRAAEEHISFLQTRRLSTWTQGLTLEEPPPDYGEEQGNSGMGTATGSSVSLRAHASNMPRTFPS